MNIVKPVSSSPAKTEHAPIHLWIYNHPFVGISDQIVFFLSIFQQHGYTVTIGRQPASDALNVVIENFSSLTARTLMNFCQATSKRVAVIMTEHLDFVDNEIHIHGTPLHNYNDYMHPATQAARIKGLMDCACYIRAFLVLGDLPELRNMGDMMPGLAVRTLPFPRINPPAGPASWAALPSDLVFTGVVTSHRATLLNTLQTMLTVRYPSGLLSHKARDRFSQTGRLVLNLPQRPDWRWLSLMRIIAALRSGRATVSLGTNDASQIATCCVQLDITQPGWELRLRDLTLQPGELFRKMLAQYDTMAEAFAVDNPFPEDFFEYWAITEL
jgi:hypothetical protein